MEIRILWCFVEQIANKSMEENPRGKEKFSLSTISLFLRESLARNNNPFARGVSHRCILSFLTFRSTDFLKIVCFIQFHFKTIPLQRDAIETIVRRALTNPMNNRQQPRVSRKTAKNTLDITTYATILHYTISMIVRIVQDIDTQLTSLDASTYSSFFFSFFFFPFCFASLEGIAITLALLIRFI